MQLYSAPLDGDTDAENSKRTLKLDSGFHAAESLSVFGFKYIKQIVDKVKKNNNKKL